MTNLLQKFPFCILRTSHACKGQPEKHVELCSLVTSNEYEHALRDVGRRNEGLKASSSAFLANVEYEVALTQDVQPLIKRFLK